MRKDIALNLLNHWHSCIDGAQTARQKEILVTNRNGYIAKLYSAGVNVKLDKRANIWKES